jgi:hypothetical protein
MRFLNTDSDVPTVAGHNLQDVNGISADEKYRKKTDEREESDISVQQKHSVRNVSEQQNPAMMDGIGGFANAKNRVKNFPYRQNSIIFVVTKKIER